jgi:hypothetical protein
MQFLSKDVVESLIISEICVNCATKYLSIALTEPISFNIFYKITGLLSKVLIWLNNDVGEANAA